MTNDELIEASISQLCKDRSSYSLDMMLRKNGYQFTDEQFNAIEQKLFDAKVIERDSMVPSRPNFKLSDNSLELGICDIGWKNYLEKKEMTTQPKIEIKDNTIIGSTVQASSSGNNQSNNRLENKNTPTPKKTISNTLIAIWIGAAATIIGTIVCYKMGLL